MIIAFHYIPIIIRGNGKPLTLEEKEFIFSIVKYFFISFLSVAIFISFLILLLFLFYYLFKKLRGEKL